MKDKISRYAIPILMILCVTIGFLAADATNWNIRARPVENWLSGSLTDPAWNWMKAIDQLVELGINPGTGSVFYVDSGVSNAGDGSNWLNAVETLDEAVDLCTADRGDYILIAQGHSETMGAAADEVDIDAHGISIKGLGTGTLRPTFDYTGDENGAFTIGADNISIDNCIFNANILEVNEGIVIQAGSTDCAITNCSFTITLDGTDEFKNCIDSEGAASDRLLIAGCIFRQGAGAAVAALHMLDSDGFIFRNNLVQGTYSTATIFGETNASTDILIVNNIFSDSSADTLNVVAASTGFVARNIVAMETSVAASLDIGNCWNIDNKLILDDDVTGALGSAAEATSYSSSTASAE